VGANGFNSTVKASTIGAQATLVSVKDQADTIANVGGIAGTNYGTVESSDNKVKAADAQTIIKNGFGYTGGIVGCSQKDAVVKGSDAERTTTSDKWMITVNIPDTNVDTAVGGIIGHSESQTALELMENNATVNVTGGNASVGGIVGKLEGGTGDTLTINKCDNYGAVTGTWYTGGLVGYLRNAAIFTGCTSKGTVTGGTTEIMVGFVDRGLENQVTFVEPDYPEGMDPYSFRPTATLADTMSEDGQAVQDINTASQTENESADSANGATMEESDGNAIADATDTAAKQDTESTEAIAVVEQLPTPDAEQLAEETWVTQYYDGTEWSLQKPANDAEQEKNTTAANSGDTHEKITGSYKTRAYTFDIQEHVDLYEVQMQDAGGAYGMLYIQPKKAKAYVYYAGSFADVRRESICDANPYSEFAGILTEENPVSASYAVNVALDDKNTVVLPAVVTMKGETISILLPDTTTYVSVQATVDEEHVDKYENSDIAVWRYILEEDATMTDAVAIGEADESGKVVWSGVLKDEARAAEVPDIAGTSVQIGSGTTAQKVVNYTVAVTQPMLVNILAYDADENLMKSAYYTVSKDAASFMLETKNWFAKSDDIRIRYSEIGDTGLGDWTEPVQLTESGFSN
ncbi:MAG: GLUG motif-containing protein, partial [Wujia sp.]